MFRKSIPMVALAALLAVTMAYAQQGASSATSTPATSSAPVKAAKATKMTAKKATHVARMVAPVMNRQGVRVAHGGRGVRRGRVASGGHGQRMSGALGVRTRGRCEARERSQRGQCRDPSRSGRLHATPADAQDPSPGSSDRAP